jgi:hypothetical protein
MEKDFLIKLTNNLYRLTLLFPKKEPLRYKMREMADEILVKPNKKSLETLDSFFEVTKSQNWVSPSDILAIQKDYDSLKRGLERNKPITTEFSKDKRETIIEVEPQLLPQRKEKILAFLRENGRVQVWQVKQFFPEVSKRTLRRDFEYLFKQGMIERIGERNNTFYQLKRNEA